MKAFLLAGGYGTRLKPLTDRIPKCLVRIDGRPLLEYWLAQLVAQGCRDILVNTHYLSEQVESFIAASQYSDYVTTVHEAKLLGTLGSIKQNNRFFDTDTTLIAHADNFCVANWQQFLQTFNNRPKNCLFSMMLFRTQTPWSCGLVRTDQQYILKEYYEKPELARTQPERFGYLANAAVFLMGREAISAILEMPDKATDLCRDFLPLQIGKAFTFLNENIHIDVGTPEAYTVANEVAKANRKAF